MINEKENILVINGGSSSIKFAMYSMDKNLGRIFSGEIKRIVMSDPEFTKMTGELYLKSKGIEMNNNKIINMAV